MMNTNNTATDKTPEQIAREERDATTERIERIITRGGDGPVTDFVVMSRAMECVKAGSDPDIVANALWNVLHIERDRNLSS